MVVGKYDLVGLQVLYYSMAPIILFCWEVCLLCLEFRLVLMKRKKKRRLLLILVLSANMILLASNL